MTTAKYFFVLCFVLLLCSINPTQGKGGRGGGGRGGGSRGSSSSGSRGSSSSGSRGSSSGSSGSHGSSSSSGGSSSGSSGSHGSSSSSGGSSSSGTQLDRSGSSSSNKPSPPKPSIDVPQSPKPSAPELPRVNPSAPRLPESPGHSQPSNPYSYNPNFPQPAKPQPDAGVRANPPSYGNVAPGNPPPYSPRENPPPYSPGNIPPYAPGNRPPYAPGNPPPYAPGNIPPYAPGNPPPYAAGNHPVYAPPPYGVNTGNIPQGPPYGQPHYGGINRPNIPQGNSPPYGVNPVPPGHGVHPGSIPYAGQPSNFPYPRQPGMSYPPGGSSWPNYYAPGGFQGITSVKPHKKKGLLGGLFSFGKKPKHHGIGGGHAGSFGAPPLGGHKISPVHMILPLSAMKKPHKPFGYKPHFWILPYAVYRSSWGGIDFDDDDDYRRRCFRPRAPIGGSISCVHSLSKLECKANCIDGYTFPDNSTELEMHCWRFSGYWNRSRFLPRCQPYCKPDECQNGAICKAPGQCQCSSEYRGDHCEYPVLKCDMIKFAKGSRITWACSHSRNETLCRVGCYPPLVFETPAAERYHCSLNGTWTPDRIPHCVRETRSTEVAQTTTTLLTQAPEEG